MIYTADQLAKLGPCECGAKVIFREETEAVGRYSFSMRWECGRSSHSDGGSRCPKVKKEEPSDLRFLRVD
ncbi:hypothetical protein UFOVP602_16 [uncultured Caudovirales phage]|jgi:hypothetical protein|uniref:Uncharacterized protein n=1 Tax=uncultured Caudovirales phage TaxID=2100421 RepID=A0A6J5N5T4_9CAUD|nr:hypothetical protein UFOVP602_16 [uncultured Caudovirales phage]